MRVHMSHYWNGDKADVLHGFTLRKMKINGQSIQLRNSEKVHLNKVLKSRREKIKRAKVNE